MALITTGNGFIRNLEKFGALGVYVPLEGGYEGRYLRRLRAAGRGAGGQRPAGPRAGP
jgi:NAD(P)H-quinone oxidoreductase subunit N